MGAANQLPVRHLEFTLSPPLLSRQWPHLSRAGPTQVSAGADLLLCRRSSPGAIEALSLGFGAAALALDQCLGCHRLAVVALRFRLPVRLRCGLPGPKELAFLRLELPGLEGIPRFVTLFPIPYNLLDICGLL
jgi:hypothetical protein